MIRKAERPKRALRLCETGPAGSGKTHSALLMASGLGKRIILIDTENSADLEAGKDGIPEFDVCPVSPPFTPQAFQKALSECLHGGAEVVIVDTLTQEWEGLGGLLDMKEKSGKGFEAWGKVMPLHNALMNQMLSYPVHLIVTLRTKTAWEMEEYERGGRTLVRPKKFGMKPSQKEGIEYEFDVIFSLDQETHQATVSKDRTSLFDGKDAFVPSDETGKMLHAWLNSGSGKSPLEVFQESRIKLECLIENYSAESEEEVKSYWREIKSEAETLAPEHYQELLKFLGEKKGKFKSEDMLAWVEDQFAQIERIKDLESWLKRMEKGVIADLIPDDKDDFYQMIDDLKHDIRNPAPTQEAA